MDRSPHRRARAAWTLVCAFAIGCDGDPGGRTDGTNVRYSYALTASGALYRVFAVGPVMRGANTAVGVQIAYLASSTDSAQLDRDAEELVRTFGPELLLTPERSLKVEARLTATDKGLRPTARRLMFERTDSGWRRAAKQPPGPPPKAAGTATQPDEAAFPFERAMVDAAAAEATRWLGLLDQQRPEAVEPLSREFTRKLASAPEFLPSLLATRRNLGLPAARTELYRMQTLDREYPQRKAGANVLVQYRATPPGAAPVLERITMLRSGSRWQVSGYLLQPIAPGELSVR